MLSTLLLPPFSIAAFFLFLPFLSRERFFTMPVPPEWRTGTQARRIRYGYQGFVLVIAVGGAVLSVSAGADNRIVYSIAVVEVFALLAVWAWGWNRTLPARLRHPILRSASLNIAARPVPAFGWTLAALLPLVAAAAYLATHYNAIPPQIPIHYTVNGVADHIVARSRLAVFGPILAGAVLILCLAALLDVVSRRSAGVPDAGRYSALTRYVFLGSTWFVALQLSAVTLLPVLSHAQTFTTHLTYISSGFLLLLFLASFGYFLRERSTLSAAQSTTTEEHWKGGLWYYNPNDAALFVPKRLGFGYTLNMGRPESWIIMAAILAIVLVPLALKHF